MSLTLTRFCNCELICWDFPFQICLSLFPLFSYQFCLETNLFGLKILSLEVFTVYLFTPFLFVYISKNISAKCIHFLFKTDELIMSCIFNIYFEIFKSFVQYHLDDSFVLIIIKSQFQSNSRNFLSSAFFFYLKCIILLLCSAKAH